MQPSLNGSKNLNILVGLTSISFVEFYENIQTRTRSYEEWFEYYTTNLKN